MNPTFDFFFPNRNKIGNQFSFILAILLMLSNFPTISDFFSQDIYFISAAVSTQC